MNKAELIAGIAAQSGLTKKQAEQALNAFIGCVNSELTSGGKVQLVSFGTFEVRERKARTGRNPKDPSKVIQIPASKAPVFKAGKALKDAVNVSKKKTPKKK